MPDPDTTSTIIQTVDEDGKAPKNRIATAAAAWGSFEKAKAQSQKDDARFASIRGQYDGMPPVPQKELDDQGIPDAPNINTRQSQAKINSYVATWIDLNTGSDQWAEVEARVEHAGSAEKAREYSEKMTAYFNEAIKEWEDEIEEGMNGAHYIFESSVRDTQMGLFGIGVPYFQDHIDWRWTTVPTRHVHVPQGTKITLANAPALHVEFPYPVTTLYDFVKDEETAARTKWNREAVLRVIYRRTEGQTDDKFARLAEWQNKIRNNSSYFHENEFPPINVVHTYVQEFTEYRAKNGISHYIVVEGEKEFLFEWDRQFKSFRQVINPFCDSCGPEGDWHGIKGFGDLVYDACHFNNLMFNHIAFGAIISTLPMFESEGEADKEKLNQVVFSRLGVLFPGLKLAQARLNTDLTGSLAVLGENNRVLNSNTRIFPQNDNGPRGEAATATQVTFDRQDEAAFTSSQIRFYRMTGADPLLTEMYRRISKPRGDYPESWPGGKVAQRFRDKCDKAGISDNCRMDVKFVRATRSGGSGNQSLDLMKAEKALGVATPGRGQLNARKEVIKSMFGHEMVPAFIESEAQPTPEVVVVSMENAMMQSGSFIPAFPFQPAEVHLGFGPDGNLGEMGHIGVLMATQKAATELQDQGVETALEDAMKLNKVLGNLTEHIAMHVNYMQTLPFLEAQVKDLQKFLNDALQFNENLTADITRAMEQQQAENPQMDPETQRIMLKTQAEIEAQRMRTQASIEDSRIKTIAKLQNQEATAESRHRIKEAEAETRLGIEAQQALINQQRQQVDIGIKVAGEVAKTRAKGNVTKNEEAKS